MQNQLGENIAIFRKEKGLSQEKVAEYMAVSRQAVTKWESNISRPSSDNLIKLAELFGVSVDVLLGNNELDNAKISTNITMSKAPWAFVVFSMLCVVIYIAASSLLNIFSFGTVICMFVVCFPIQLFMHIYLSNAVNNDSFTGIAGFDERIEYNYIEVKKMLVEIDLHIGMLSSVCVFLLCAINFADLNISWLNGLLILLYCLNFILTILINNYRSINKIYCKEKDKKRAIKSIPITVVYLLLLFAGIGITVLLFELRGIENNTIPAMKLSGFLLVGVFVATIGFFVENNNIRKWSENEIPYRVNKISVASMFACLVLYAFMCII